MPNLEGGDTLKSALEDTARYLALLLAPAEGLGFGLLCCFFVNFWCPVVTLVTFSSNPSNFKRNPKKKQQKKLKKKIQKNSKKFQNFKNLKKSPNN